MAGLWKVKPPIDAPSNGIWLGPSAEAAGDGLWLGFLAEMVGGKQPQVWLGTKKEQVVAIVGKRGSGKSFTLGVLAEGLALAGAAPQISRQTRPRATLLFDPLDVYWTTRFPVGPSQNNEAARHYELAKAMKLTGAEFNVEAWVPGSHNLRPTDPPWFQALRLPVPALGLDEWGLMLDLDMLAEPMGQALADVIQLVAFKGYQARGVPTPPKPVYELSDLRDALSADDIVAVYHVETLRGLRQRLVAFENSGLFSAQGTPITTLLAAGRLTVVLLGRLPQAHRSAVVAVLTRLLVDERARVAFVEKRLQLDPTLHVSDREGLEAAVQSGIPRTVVALDEAQTFLAPGQEGIARDVFVRLVKEGRNIGLSAALATQQPSALDPRILSQVETFIAHQLVTEPDINAVRANLKATLPDSMEFGTQQVRPVDLLRMLSPGQCLISAADMNTAVRRSLVVNIRPRATIHGGIEL